MDRKSREVRIINRKMKLTISENSMVLIEKVVGKSSTFHIINRKMYQILLLKKSSGK